jgi:hypothetical protein
MASPNFTRAPRVSSVLITAGYAQSQTAGTVGTDSFLLFTPGASGAYISYVLFIATATTPTNTTATTGRVYVATVNTGTTTTANAWCIGEINLPLTAAGNATAAQTPLPLVIDRPIEAGQYLLVTNHANPAANTAWRAIAYGGDY